jgi:hypothetical protein
MERYFIATKESELVKDINKYIQMCKEQSQFVKKFCDEKGIEAHEYIISGDGTINQPFGEYWKKNIKFYINPTDKDKEILGKYLTKPSDRHGLCAFKKSSAIAKEFADLCVKEKVVINLHACDLRNYFKSIGWNGYNRTLFEIDNGDYYLKVESKGLKEDDTPEGMIEIKGSEFYLAMEEHENKSKQKENED